MKYNKKWKYIIALCVGMILFVASGRFILNTRILATVNATGEEAQNGVNNNIFADMLFIQLTHGSQQQKIQLWSGDGAIYYAFLPAYASMEQSTFVYDNVTYQITLDGKSVETGATLRQLSVDTHTSYSLHIQTNPAVTEAANKADNAAVLDRTVTLQFMQSAKTNTMYIGTASGSMDYIHEVKGNEETGYVSLYHADGNLDYAGALEKIRGRGNNSWWNEKKAYQIKLEERIDLLGMGSAKTWILLAGAGDGSAIRNKIVFDMAQEKGIPFAQNSEYVDLYLNGEYAGLYLLTEKIQVNKNRIEIEDLEEATEKMNPETDLALAETFQSEDGLTKGIAGVRNPDDITGGYLLEWDNFYEEEPSTFNTLAGGKFTISSPQYATQEEVSYISSLMQRVENAIMAEDGIDPESRQHYTDLIDFDGLVTKYLFDEVTKCDDGWRGSNYFYKYADTTDSKIYCGPVWDYDLSLGNCPSRLFVGADDPRGITQLRRSTWYAALWKKLEFQQAVIASYNEFFKPYMEQLLAGGIDDYEQQVQTAVAMNDTRWQYVDEHATVYETHGEQIAYLKNFITKRLDYLDEVWNEGVVYHEVGFEGVEYQYVRDGECAVLPAEPTQAGYRFLGWYHPGSDEEKFSPYQPVWADTTFEARWEPLQGIGTEDTVQTTNGGNWYMILVALMLLLIPGLITMRIADKSYESGAEQETYKGKICGRQIIDVVMYDFIIMLANYAALGILGSSAITEESLQYPLYVVKYAGMAMVFAVALGILVRVMQHKKRK